MQHSQGGLAGAIPKGLQGSVNDELNVRHTEQVPHVKGYLVKEKMIKVVMLFFTIQLFKNSVLLTSKVSEHPEKKYKREL